MCLQQGTPFTTPEPAFTNTVAAAEFSATATYFPTSSDIPSLFGDNPIEQPVNVSAIVRLFLPHSVPAWTCQLRAALAAFPAFDGYRWQQSARYYLRDRSSLDTSLSRRVLLAHEPRRSVQQRADGEEQVSHSSLQLTI